MLVANMLPMSLVESSKMWAVADSLNNADVKLFLIGLLNVIRRAEQCLTTVSAAWVSEREKLSLYPSIVGIFQTPHQ